MLMVADVHPDRQRHVSQEKNLFGIDKLNLVRSEVPAVTHVDYSARIQAVHEDTNEKSTRSSKSFMKRPGVQFL